MITAPPTLILFGGSFNPPHNAHVALAEAALNKVENSRVVWMPAATPPHKQYDSDLASAKHRLAMVRLAAADNDRFEVSDSEIRRGAVSYTVDTLRALKKRYADVRLALLFGGDSLAQFPTWREPEAILKLARLLVYRRPGAREGYIPGWVKKRVTFIDAPQIDVSSTNLRERIRSGFSARGLVPDAVLASIEEHGLYR